MDKKNKKILALSGWKRSGKDTVADYLCNEYNFNKYTFAYEMKKMVTDLYNLTLDDLTDQKLKEMPLLQYPVLPKDSFNIGIHELLKHEFREHEGNLYFTPRSLLILEGSVKRSVCNQYWTDKLIDSIKNDKSNKIVISDLRFEAEYKELEKAFGDSLVTVRINRFDSVNTSDPSERNLDNSDFDVFIENKGELKELYNDIDRLMGFEDVSKVK